MAAKKHPGKQEPLLNTVARKLGRAAGTLTKVTQEWTENLSTIPESVATKVRKSAKTLTKSPRVRSRRQRTSTATVGIAKPRRGKSLASKRKRIKMKG